MEAWRLIMLLTLVGSISSSLAAVCREHGEICHSVDSQVPHRMKRGLGGKLRIVNKLAPAVQLSSSLESVADTISILPVTETVNLNLQNPIAGAGAGALVEPVSGLSAGVKETVGAPVGAAFKLPTDLQLSADTSNSDSSVGTGLGDTNIAVSDLVPPADLSTESKLSPPKINVSNFVAALANASQPLNSAGSVNVTGGESAAISAPNLDAFVSTAGSSADTVAVASGTVGAAVEGVSAGISGVPAAAAAAVKLPSLGLGARANKRKSKPKSLPNAPQIQSGAVVEVAAPAPPAPVFHTQVEPIEPVVFETTSVVKPVEDATAGIMSVLGGFGANLESDVTSIAEEDIGAQVLPGLVGIESVIPEIVPQLEADVAKAEFVVPEIVADFETLAPQVGAGVAGTGGLSSGGLFAEVGSLLPQLGATASASSGVQAEVPKVEAGVKEDLASEIETIIFPEIGNIASELEGSLVETISSDVGAAAAIIPEVDSTIVSELPAAVGGALVSEAALVAPAVELLGPEIKPIASTVGEVEAGVSEIGLGVPGIVGQLETGIEAVAPLQGLVNIAVPSAPIFTDVKVEAKPGPVHPPKPPQRQDRREKQMQQLAQIFKLFFGV